jgi:hypothetical protein
MLVALFGRDDIFVIIAGLMNVVHEYMKYLSRRADKTQWTVVL